MHQALRLSDWAGLSKANHNIKNNIFFNRKKLEDKVEQGFGQKGERNMTGLFLIVLSFSHKAIFALTLSYKVCFLVTTT